MLLRDTKTRNITFCGEETSQILLTAFSLLAANKSTIIKMLSKWLEIFLTLSKFHISWVDYPGQRIYHLPECLSSRKLKDSYKHCLINPYIKTCRENGRKCHHSRLQLLKLPTKKPPETHGGCRVGPYNGKVSGQPRPRARPPASWVQSLQRNCLDVRLTLFKEMHFISLNFYLPLLPLI